MTGEASYVPWLDQSHANYAMFYIWIFEQAVRWSRTRGWALAVHGSLRRDLDLLAVPWSDEAISTKEYIEGFHNVVGTRNPISTTLKPHGRVACSFVYGLAYIDLSILDPRIIKEEMPR